MLTKHCPAARYKCLDIKYSFLAMDWSVCRVQLALFIACWSGRTTLYHGRPTLVSRSTFCQRSSRESTRLPASTRCLASSVTLYSCKGIAAMFFDIQFRKFFLCPMCWPVYSIHSSKNAPASISWCLSCPFAVSFYGWQPARRFRKRSEVYYLVSDIYNP